MITDQIKIEVLSSEFRNAIEIARDEGCFDPYNTPLKQFPRACCGEASDVLGQYLVDHDIADLWYVRGDHYPHTGDDEEDFQGIHSHAWISIGNPFDSNSLIVDITGDQKAFKCDHEYGYHDVPVYVGKWNSFYDSFELDRSSCHEYHGISDYDEGAQGILYRLYDLIVERIG